MVNKNITKIVVIIFLVTSLSQLYAETSQAQQSLESRQKDDNVKKDEKKRERRTKQLLIAGCGATALGAAGFLAWLFLHNGSNSSGATSSAKVLNPFSAPKQTAHHVLVPPIGSVPAPGHVLAHEGALGSLHSSTQLSITDTMQAQFESMMNENLQSLYRYNSNGTLKKTIEQEHCSLVSKISATGHQDMWHDRVNYWSSARIYAKVFMLGQTVSTFNNYPSIKLSVESTQLINSELGKGLSNCKVCKNLSDLSSLFLKYTGDDQYGRPDCTYNLEENVLTIRGGDKLSDLFAFAFAHKNGLVINEINHDNEALNIINKAIVCDNFYIFRYVLEEIATLEDLLLFLACKNNAAWIGGFFDKNFLDVCHEKAADATTAIKDALPAMLRRVLQNSSNYCKSITEQEVHWGFGHVMPCYTEKAELAGLIKILCNEDQSLLHI